MEALDTADRGEYIRQTILKKPSLRHFYDDIYREFMKCLSHCSENGIAIELGSGVGFAKSIIPGLVATDILPYEGLDLIVDGTKLPFADNSLRMICMMNAFHHIPDVKSFLGEAERCLVPGGRILIADQHVGILSRFILKYVHHEPFDPKAKNWEFDPSGPLSGANGALAWIVFMRDRKVFEILFPQLNIVRYEPHSPMRYWLTGGLKKWNLLPGRTHSIWKIIDTFLTRLSPEFCSFVFIEILKESGRFFTENGERPPGHSINHPHARNCGTLPSDR
jgi:SAM-dependent methyltransferase